LALTPWVGSAQPRLQVAEHAVDAGQDLTGAPRIALRARTMSIAHVAQRRVALPTVRHDRRAWRDVGLHEPSQGCPRRVRYHLEPYASGALASNLDRSDHQRLVAQLAASAKVDLRAADIRLVHLDLVAQQIATWAHHCAPELVQERPCGLVPTDPELALELERRQSRRVRRDQVGGPEPLGQRRPGPMQYGASGHGGVASARPTTPQESSWQLEGIAMTAGGTAKTVRPS